MMQFAFNQIIVPPGQKMLTDISWSIFEKMLEELGESRADRLSYNDGMVEIMAPLAVKEDNTLRTDVMLINSLKCL